MVTNDTIFSGISHLVKSGMFPIAIIVFTASILVPWLKTETGIDWKIVGNHLLNSETTTMFLPISSMWDKLGGIFAQNNFTD